MSFISDRVGQYNISQRKYTVEWLEKELVAYFFERIKLRIEAAIRNGESHCGEYFYTDTEYDNDGIYNRPLKGTAEEYLNDPKSYSFVKRLVDFIDRKDRSAAEKVEKQINLTNVENQVQRAVLALGAKRVSFYVRYYEDIDILVYKDSFWRGRHQVKKKWRVCQYKVCYYVSW